MAWIAQLWAVSHNHFDHFSRNQYCGYKLLDSCGKSLVYSNSQVRQMNVTGLHFAGLEPSSPVWVVIHLSKFNALSTQWMEEKRHICLTSAVVQQCTISLGLLPWWASALPLIQLWRGHDQYIQKCGECLTGYPHLLTGRSLGLTLPQTAVFCIEKTLCGCW